MQYIREEQEFFKDFITGTYEGSINQYIERKSDDGVWGDDIEI